MEIEQPAQPAPLEVGRPPGSKRPRRSFTLVVLGTAAALAAIGLSSAALLDAAPGQGALSHKGVHVLLASDQTRALAPGATITVTGHGTVEGTPNTVSFVIGVNTTEPTATAALAANDGQVSHLEATLEQHGVAKTDMQTSNLDVYPKTDEQGDVTGFTVDDDLNVKMTDTAKAGAAIDAGAAAVGNGVDLYGISFGISNESALLARARANAVVDARTEAAQVAAGAGLSLGPVQKITDQENTDDGQVVYGASLAAAPSASVPIETGQQALSVQVSVVYTLR